MSQDFLTMFKKPQFRINYIPMDSREQTSRWRGRSGFSGVMTHEFTLFEIEEIIRSGDLSMIRELSRYYYRTNGRYRNMIDALASFPLYDTVITPVFETGKGSKAQITKAFYNACAFVDALDVKNTLTRITREWIKSGIYYGIIQEQGSKVVVQDLPMEFCRARYKDFNNLMILEFNLAYFETKYDTKKVREAALLNFPEVIQKGWQDWKNNKLPDSWIQVPAKSGGVVFCFAEDQTPLLLAAIPDLFKLNEALGREEKRDENELYKLLIHRMPYDSDGHLVYELDEIAEMHAGISSMLKDLDTVDVLTTFGETSLENLQDASNSTSANNRLEKYNNNAWDTLGISELFFNADNSSSMAYVIKRIESVMRTYLNMYDTWIRFLINERFSRTGMTFDFQILPLTVYNLKEMQAQYLSGAQFGYSKMIAGVSMGVKQRDLISMIDFENDFLGLTEKMKPLMSSYTSTGEEGSGKKNNSGEKNSSSSVKVKDISNKGGRPELPDEQKSEKTQANIKAMG